AEGALLHHADFADRDVRVELKMERLVPGRIEEVEEANAVRARVRAVARPDAAIVDLGVEPFGGMVAGGGRADRLARRRIALLTHHGPELETDVWKLALPVALDAKPVHRSAPSRLHVADSRDVVLGVTGRHARATSIAAIQIDRKSPLVWHSF